MSVSLVKGQKVSLTKEHPNLRNVFLGLGWDPAKNLSRDVDCDAFAVLLRGKFVKKSDIVYFGNLKHKSGSIIHHGDNLTGDGDGDDEVIEVRLDSIPEDVTCIVLGVSIYDGKGRKQSFDMISSAFIRLVDKDANKELYRYDLSDSYQSCRSVIFGELYRHNTEWKFNPIGEGYKEDSIFALAKMYK